MAYASLEPFGEGMSDFRAGQICSTVANYAGKVRNEDVPCARPEDFMPALSEWTKKPDTKPKKSGPVLLDNPAKQSALLKQIIFRIPENG